MTVLGVAIPFLSSAVSFVFAALVIRRFAVRRGPHHLLWAIGLLFYAVGGLCEGLSAAAGPSDLVFRFWYLCGAVLSAAWLGQGTVYLWLPRRWAHALMALLAAGSVFGAFRVFGAQLDLSTLGHAGSAIELSGKAIVSGGVRSLTPFFNSYGTLALVAGATWSVIQLARRKLMPARMAGNLFIAVGAFMPALGGTVSRLGVTGLLYIMELLGAVLLFVGFLLSTRETGAAGS